jgi:hypothetical protein
MKNVLAQQLFNDIHDYFQSATPESQELMDLTRDYGEYLDNLPQLQQNDGFFGGLLFSGQNLPNLSNLNKNNQQNNQQNINKNDPNLNPNNYLNPPTPIPSFLSQLLHKHQKTLNSMTNVVQQRRFIEDQIWNEREIYLKNHLAKLPEKIISSLFSLQNFLQHPQPQALQKKLMYSNRVGNYLDRMNQVRQKLVRGDLFGKDMGKIKRDFDGQINQKNQPKFQTNLFTQQNDFYKPQNQTKMMQHTIFNQLVQANGIVGTLKNTFGQNQTSLFPFSQNYLQKIQNGLESAAQKMFFSPKKTSQNDPSDDDNSLRSQRNRSRLSTRRRGSGSGNGKKLSLRQKLLQRTNQLKKLAMQERNNQNNKIGEKNNQNYSLGTTLILSDPSPYTTLHDMMELQYSMDNTTMVTVNNTNKMKNEIFNQNQQNNQQTDQNRMINPNLLVVYRPNNTVLVPQPNQTSYQLQQQQQPLLTPQLATGGGNRLPPPPPPKRPFNPFNFGTGAGDNDENKDPNRENYTQNNNNNNNNFFGSLSQDWKNFVSQAEEQLYQDYLDVMSAQE